MSYSSSLILAISALSFERNQQVLFTNLNQQLGAGQLLQLQGANGSGKSTFLRILAGFLLPQEGEVCFNGRNIHVQRDHYQQQLHYLGHQNGLRLQLTVRENLHLACALHQIKFQDLDIHQILAYAGLTKLENTLTLQLSAGQQRRLSLVRLLLSPSPIWILDEPITALDVSGQTFFAQILDAHLAKNGIAIIATHQRLQINTQAFITTIGESCA